MSRSASSHLLDRSLGIAVTITGTIAVGYALKWLHDAIRRRNAQPRLRNDDEKRELDDLARGEHSKVKNSHASRGGAVACETSHSHTHTTPSHNRSPCSLAENVVHLGCCHCQRVRFKIFAPRILNAVDISSKLRFPRITIVYEDFELLSDPSTLSMYTVRPSENNNDENIVNGNINPMNSMNTHDMNVNNVGIHSFCSFCGTHVLFAPNTDPVEVQVNVDCLALDNLEKVHCAYHSSTEQVPAHNALLDQRGSGSSPVVPPLGPLFSHRQSRRSAGSVASSYSTLPTVPEESLAWAQHERGGAHNNNNNNNKTSSLRRHAVDVNDTLLAQREQYLTMHAAPPHNTQRVPHSSAFHTQPPPPRYPSYHVAERDIDSESLNSVESGHDPLLFSHYHTQPAAPALNGEYFAPLHTAPSHNRAEHYGAAVPHSPTQDFYQQYYGGGNHGSSAAVRGLERSLAGETDQDDRYSVPSPVPSDSGDSSHTNSLVYAVRETRRRSRRFAPPQTLFFPQSTPFANNNNAMPSADVSPLSAATTYTSSASTSFASHATHATHATTPLSPMDHKSTHHNLRKHLNKHRNSSGSASSRNNNSNDHSAAVNNNGNSNSNSNSAKHSSVAAPVSFMDETTEAELLLGVL